MNRREQALGMPLGGILLTLAVALAGCGDSPVSGTVIDGEAQYPIQHAELFHNGVATQSDLRGRFVLKRPDPAQALYVRAVGYRPMSVPLQTGELPAVRLERFQMRGIYLSYTALGRSDVRARVLNWLDGDILNTLVLDLKDEGGRMSFYNSAPEAGQMGAFGDVRFEDFRAFLRDRHRSGVYVVGRISVFQDGLLAKHKPQLRPKAKGTGTRYWLDPFRKEVWDYSLAVAREAAAAGVDEIQFSHVRFPTQWELPAARYAKRNTEANRLRCLAGFLTRARQELAPLNTNFSLEDTVPFPSLTPDEAGRYARRLGGMADGIIVRVLPGESLDSLRSRYGGEAGKLRVLVRFPDHDYVAPGRSSAEQARGLINACEAARWGGWIIADPTSQYAFSKGVLAEMLGSPD